MFFEILIFSLTAAFTMVWAPNLLGAAFFALPKSIWGAVTGKYSWKLPGFYVSAVVVQISIPVVIGFILQTLAPGQLRYAISTRAFAFGELVGFGVVISFVFFSNDIRGNFGVDFTHTAEKYGTVSTPAVREDSTADEIEFHRRCGKMAYADRDLRSAEEHFRISALDGDTDSRALLALVLVEIGHRDKDDATFIEGEFWYRVAAWQGSAMAQCMVGGGSSATETTRDACGCV